MGIVDMGKRSAEHRPFKGFVVKKFATVIRRNAFEDGSKCFDPICRSIPLMARTTAFWVLRSVRVSNAAAPSPWPLTTSSISQRPASRRPSTSAGRSLMPRPGSTARLRCRHRDLRVLFRCRFSHNDSLVTPGTFPASTMLQMVFALQFWTV